MRYVRIYILISIIVYVVGIMVMIKMPTKESYQNQVAFVAVLINMLVAIMLGIIKWRKL